MSWIEDKANAVIKNIENAKSRQRYPYFRPFESGGIHTTVNGHSIINFSSNDYLGLTNHPKVKEAAKAAVDRYACGLGSSRIQATGLPHVELEKRLASWFGFEESLIFTTGYQAMVGTIISLADADTTIIIDSYSHASILDGTFLAAGMPQNKPEIRFFNHNSIQSLERILKEKTHKNTLVIFEGIYSLDGDMANIGQLADICERYEAIMICDDAHGTGTLGAKGTGIIEHCHLHGRIPIVVTTFSKTFGGIGGLLLGSRNVVEFIKHTARSFIFTASLPIPIVATVGAILDILESEGSILISELRAKANYMRSCLNEMGFDLGISNTHIMPILCRDYDKVMLMHFSLFENGIMLFPMIYPAVKPGEERLRLNITCGHSIQDMNLALGLLSRYGKKFGILPEENIG